jgi:hypothetical protein
MAFAGFGDVQRVLTKLLELLDDFWFFSHGHDFLVSANNATALSQARAAC